MGRSNAVLLFVVHVLAQWSMCGAATTADLTNYAVLG